MELEMITGEQLATFTGMVVALTLIVQLIKGIAYDFLGLEGKQIKALSFALSFLIAGFIQIFFQGFELSPQGVFLLILNAFLASVASNGLYGWFEKEEK
jgi:hypothetical protein